MIARHATKDERGLFLALFAEMLRENHAIGGEFPPTQRNVEGFGVYFDAYTSGELRGVALLATDVSGMPGGCLLWGDPGPRLFETIWDPFAVGHGTYVHPDHRGSGISTGLRALAKAEMRAMGFRKIIGSAVASNATGIASGKASAGFKVHGLVGVIDLEETK